MAEGRSAASATRWWSSPRSAPTWGRASKGLSARLHRRGRRGVAAPAAGRGDRPLSLALARPGHALRGDARRLCQADRGGQGARRSAPRTSTPRQLARGAEGRRATRACRATRCCSPNTTSTIGPSSRGRSSTLCRGEGLGVITYFSLAKGFLTGKYRARGRSRPRARAAGGSPATSTRAASRSSAALDEVALDHGAKPAEVALAWVIAQPGITAPIASATTLEQMRSLVRATELKLSPDEVAALDAAA